MLHHFEIYICIMNSGTSNITVQQTLLTCENPRLKYTYFSKILVLFEDIKKAFL